MFKRIAIILITTLTLTVNVSAGSDGELLLKKNDPSSAVSYTHLTLPTTPYV